MVMVFEDHVADTPAGKPFAPDTPSLAIPVAPVVLCVIAVKAVLMHSVGDDDPAPAVLSGVTIIVPVALILPHPPVRRML